MNLSLNGGTLTWTATFSTGTCAGSQYDQYSYTNFAYSYDYPSTFNAGEEIPVTVNFGGTAGYIYNSPGPPYCPPNGPEPASGTPLVDSTDFYRISFMPTADGKGTASMESFAEGGVGPSFVILAVIYAPPNPGGTNSFGPSFVDYTNTTELGTSTTFDNSFQQSYTYTVSGGFFGISSSLGSGYSQTNDSSESISVNQQTSLSNKYPGLEPAETVGLNHDNDIVLLWINPAINCTAEQAWTVLPIPAAVQCLVYDPKMAPGDPDDPEMDIVQLPVGWLDGDYPMNQDVQYILSQHRITSVDYPTLLAADPYESCQSSISCVQNTVGLDAPRYDLVTGAGIMDFEPIGNSTSYQADYETTSTQGQTVTDSHTLSYTLSGSANFENIWNQTIKDESTFTWTNKWSTTTTSKVGQIATITINEPSGNYSGPTQFAVYKDNVYGTFMSYPTQ